MTGGDAFLRHVLAQAEKRQAAIEQACGAALQGGVGGVLIYKDADGVERVGAHPNVPYGMIHEFPWGLPEGWGE